MLHAVDGIHEQFLTAAPSTRIRGPKRQSVQIDSNRLEAGQCVSKVGRQSLKGLDLRYTSLHTVIFRGW